MTKDKNNTTLKIFALIIAIVLWSYVMSEVNPEETIEYRNINVAFNNLETLDRQSLQVMEPNEVSVSVRVTGKRSDMADFSSEYIKANLDLSGYSEGQKKVPINVKLDQPGNIKITSYEPKEVLFTFDRLIERKKAVTIKTEGKLESGYVLGNLETESQNILLKGPRSWINEVAEVVATVNLDGRTKDTKVNEPIKLLDDEGNDVRGLEKEPSSIDINVPILRTTKIPIELQIENQLPDNYEITEISINPNNIGVKGSDDIFKITAIKTKPVDIDGLTQDTEISVELELPQGVQLMDPNEKVTVLLKIEEFDSKTFSYTLDEFQMQNLDKNLKIDEKEYLKEIEVTVKGSKNDIKELEKDDLEPYLELDTGIEGLNQAHIKFNHPSNINIEDIKPQPVEILLIEN